MNMQDRQQPARHSETRKRMQVMKPGEEIKLPIAEYVNAHSSQMRLNDLVAEGEPRWGVSRKKGILRVWRSQ